ncbi:MAG: General secretory pathway protein E [candidate division TM6 bacterium GW2011_GWF2_37_49]|nr:MAG: General secretory pathway protein E [candidate division TM6 bacterium GW2011_GWF2_37_49]
MLQGDGIKSTVYKLLSPEDKISQGIKHESTIEFVDCLLYTAINVHASDIHIQPEEDRARIRFRIDGTLYDQEDVSSEISKLVISRIKILAGLDIATQRLPQDGKIKILMYENFGRTHIIDLRISTFPSTYGEKMVVRILDREYNLLELESLGFDKPLFESVKNLVSKPHGFFLVTGPTGAGKTTTLYAMLSYLNNPGKNIITMEDPVEYALDGITQSQVNEKAGFIFQNGLRSLLRQDPDIIMIGEIRDKITAQIAIEAALTGHMVFSTLHTNDAAGAVTRLLDMDVEPFLISATLTGVIAQRLARKLCSSCKKTIDNSTFKNLENLSTQSYVSNGCSKCFNLGHSGRIGIFELLVLDEKIKNLIVQKSSNEVIQKQAKENGMITLQDDGIQKVKSGQISLDEFLSTIAM